MMIIRAAYRSLTRAIMCLAVCAVAAGAMPAPAEASVARGEAAFARGDYETALSAFGNPARNGDPVAQYYMGVLFAEGLTRRRLYEDALMWFICAQTAPLPDTLKNDARARQAGLVKVISIYEFNKAEARAESLCGAVPSAVLDARAAADRLVQQTQPQRGAVGSVLFFPGDATVTGAVVVFHEMGLYSLRDFLAGMINYLGDLLFGLLALFGWFVIGKVGYFFVEPIWARVMARQPSTGADTGGTAGAARADADGN